MVFMAIAARAWGLIGTVLDCLTKTKCCVLLGNNTGRAGTHTPMRNATVTATGNQSYLLLVTFHVVVDYYM